MPCASPSCSPRRSGRGAAVAPRLERRLDPGRNGPGAPPDPTSRWSRARADYAVGPVRGHLPRDRSKSRAIERPTAAVMGRLRRSSKPPVVTTEATLELDRHPGQVRSRPAAGSEDLRRAVRSAEAGQVHDASPSPTGRRSRGSATSRSQAARRRRRSATRRSRRGRRRSPRLTANVAALTTAEPARSLAAQVLGRRLDQGARAVRARLRDAEVLPVADVRPGRRRRRGRPEASSRATASASSTSRSTRTTTRRRATTAGWASGACRASPGSSWSAATGRSSSASRGRCPWTSCRPR